MSKLKSDALELITGDEVPETEDFSDSEFLRIYDQAEKLYALIHQRYIYTPAGVKKVLDKYKRNIYGTCPRYACNQLKVLPYGKSATFKKSICGVFCMGCNETYENNVHSAFLDGAFYGPSYPQFFLLYNKKINVSQINEKYVPQIHGFKIYGKHGSAFEGKEYFEETD